MPWWIVVFRCLVFSLFAVFLARMLIEFLFSDDDDDGDDDDGGIPVLGWVHGG